MSTFIKYFIKNKSLLFIFAFLTSSQLLFAAPVDKEPIDLEKYQWTRTFQSILNNYAPKNDLEKSYVAFLWATAVLQNDITTFAVGLGDYKKLFNQFLNNFKQQHGRLPTQLEVFAEVLNMRQLTAGQLRDLINQALRTPQEQVVKKQKKVKSTSSAVSKSQSGSSRIEALLAVQEEKVKRANKVKTIQMRRSNVEEQIIPMDQNRVILPVHIQLLNDALNAYCNEETQDKRIARNDQKSVAKYVLKAFTVVFPTELAGLTVNTLITTLNGVRRNNPTGNVFENREHWIRALHNYLLRELGGEDAGVPARIQAFMNQPVTNDLNNEEARAVFEALGYRTALFIGEDHVPSDEDEFVVFEEEQTALATLLYAAAVQAIRQSIFDVLLPGGVFLLGVRVHDDYLSM